MRLIDILNSALLFLAALVLIILLAMYSLREEEHGYNKSDVDALNALVASGRVLKHPRKFSQTEVMAEVWNLTDTDVSRPIYLFGKDGGKI